MGSKKSPPEESGEKGLCRSQPRENKNPREHLRGKPSPVRGRADVQWYSPAREETTAKESEGHEQAFPIPTLSHPLHPRKHNKKLSVNVAR